MNEEITLTMFRAKRDQEQMMEQDHKKRLERNSSWIVKSFVLAVTNLVIMGILSFLSYLTRDQEFAATTRLISESFQKLTLFVSFGIILFSVFHVIYSYFSYKSLDKKRNELWGGKGIPISICIYNSNIHEVEVLLYFVDFKNMDKDFGKPISLGNVLPEDEIVKEYESMMGPLNAEY